MVKCDQICPWNYYEIGCKKPNNELCPMSNLATKEKTKTNADRIRAMSDEELANWLARTQYANIMEAAEIFGAQLTFEEEILKGSEKECLEWLKQPAEGE